MHAQPDDRELENVTEKNYLENRWFMRFMHLDKTRPLCFWKTPTSVGYTGDSPWIIISVRLLSAYRKRCGKFRMFLNFWHTWIPAFVWPMPNHLNHQPVMWLISLITPITKILHPSSSLPHPSPSFSSSNSPFLHLSIPHFLSALFPVSCINAARWDGGVEGQWPLSGHAVWTGLLCP